MANAEYGWDKNVDDGTVTAGNAVSSQPATNVQTASLKERWHSGNNSSHLLVDFGSDISFNFTAFFNTNLTSSATRRVRVTTAANGDSTGAAGDAHDSTSGSAGVDATYGTLAYAFSSTVTGRWLRIDVADTSLSNIKVGRWWAGETQQPGINIAVGYALGLSTTSRRNVGPFGDTQTNRGGQQRTREIEHTFLTESELHDFVEAVNREVELFSDLCFIYDRDSSNLSRDTIWMQLQDMIPVNHKDLSDKPYRARLSLIERAK